MRVSVGITALVLGLLALDCGMLARAQPQQPNTPVTETFPSAYAKANQKCNALWSDHAFDWLRSKIPLGDEKPTFSMLTNKERLRSKDRSVADLAIKTLEKCRSAYAPAYSLLPQQISGLIQGAQRKQDALITELYKQKITFGDFNVAIDLMAGELREAISKLPNSPIPNIVAASQQPPTNDANNSTSSQQRTERFHDIRLALIIGNSDYANLPKLSNPANDARSIAEVLEKMGYRTKLLLDASDHSIRNEVRKFASESTKADVALVYYAGHGAQLNGNNYLLPIDIETPRTEADIQFAGLKVDDLVNSIGSNTKIVFLDACRDNPALFKNIVKGRGAAPVGLAPASTSNLNPAKPGGGVFIAYATDAGAVADDGHGQHSPFTQAILHYMQKPVSIDDMFSLVTREVRLVTKDAQRPYKYASLENIICLTPNCSTTAVSAVPDIVQQAKRSEDEDLQMALQTNSADALETYLQKYPDAPKRREVLSKLRGITRSEFTEWTLYEIGDRHNPQYIRLSSIQRFADRAAAETKWLVDEFRPKVFYGKTLPDAAYGEDLSAYDCTQPIMRTAEQTIFNKSGEPIFHYKWGDPQYLNLSVGDKLPPGSVGLAGRYIVCNEEIATPLVSKKQIAEMKFVSLSSTATGDGDLFYGVPLQRSSNDQDEKEVLFIVKNHKDHSIGEFLKGAVIANAPNYRIEVDHTRLKCGENKFAFDRVESWNASNELVRVQALDAAVVSFSEFNNLSPFELLQRIVCGKPYAGLGIQLASDNGSTRVAQVFGGSPAEKGGVKTNDVITQIDNEPISGMTPEQVIGKIRGVANTKVVLTLLRDGRNDPFDLTITREEIRLGNMPSGPAK